eukprot:1181638-Prorocentrum_minimum.AAC.4
MYSVYLFRGTWVSPHLLARVPGRRPPARLTGTVREKRRRLVYGSGHLPHHTAVARIERRPQDLLRSTDPTSDNSACSDACRAGTRDAGLTHQSKQQNKPKKDTVCQVANGDSHVVKLPVDVLESKPPDVLDRTVRILRRRAGTPAPSQRAESATRATPELDPPRQHTGSDALLAALCQAPAFTAHLYRIWCVWCFYAVNGVRVCGVYMVYMVYVPTLAASPRVVQQGAVGSHARGDVRIRSGSFRTLPHHRKSAPGVRVGQEVIPADALRVRPKR